MPVREHGKWRMAHDHFPLALAGICHNCEAVFELRPVCPACTSRSVESIETYLVGRREARQRADFIQRVEEEVVTLTKGGRQHD